MTASQRWREKLKLDPARYQVQLAREAAWRAKYRAERPEQYKAKFRFHNAKRKVGVQSQEEYDKWMAISACAICGSPAEVIDHCHKTSKIRGRLCANCNSGLGFFTDDIARMQAAIGYLEAHGQQVK